MSSQGALLSGTLAFAAAPVTHLTGAAATATSNSMSSGRLMASSAAVVGLIGLVIGGLALARPSSRFGTHHGRRGVGAALTAGLIAVALGGLVVATADGGVGTGNGLAGGIVAVVVGLIAMTLGGLALRQP